SVPTSRLWRRARPDVPLFLFRAADGIRAFHVTGVQPCALPIFLGDHDDRDRLAAAGALLGRRRAATATAVRQICLERGVGYEPRSEERRVGKETTRCWRTR